MISTIVCFTLTHLVLCKCLKAVNTSVKKLDLFVVKMKTRAAFQTQLATIMETLTKAAVTEINKLVEDGSVVLRLEVFRSNKEMNRLRSKLQHVESELRTAQEARTRESRSIGVQVADQFEAAGGAVKQLMEQNGEAQACDSRPEFGYTVKEEQEEERVAQILHQTESEDRAGRLNNVGPEYVMFEIDNPLCSSFTQVDSNVTDNPVCAKATEQNSQSQSVLSPKQHNNTSMVVPGSTMSALGEDNLVLEGGVVKEEAVSRSHKEINRLMSKLQQVESELRTAQEAATRESRSVGVQVADQFEAAGGAVKQLMEQNCEAQACDSRPEFGYTVKEEQEEERVAQILHQTESEDSAGRLNNVGPEKELQQKDNELRTAHQAASRDSCSAGVQVVGQFEAVGGAVKGGADAPFVEQLNEKKCKAQTCDTRSDYGFAVKEEQEEEHVTQILHQTESEHSVGRLNNVGSEYVMFERDHQLWGCFTQGDSNFSDDPVSANATKQYSRSQTIPSPIQHFHSTMEMSEITLSSLENDGYVVDGGVVKEEAGGQCLYSEESRSEIGGAQQMEQEQPPLLTNDNVTSQVIYPVLQQFDWHKGVAENSTDPVSSTNQNARNPRRPVSRSHKEINRLMSKLQQVESELRTAQEAATRESRSVGVQVADQFEAAEGAVKQLMEQNCEAQACDSRPEFGYTVKEEQEEERVAQILHQTESEDSAGRLNNVGPERELQQKDNELRTAHQAASRDSCSAGVQVVDQFEAAGGKIDMHARGCRGAVKGGADAPFVEQLNEKKCKAQMCDTRSDYGFAVKEEQEEEHVTQILHQTESEHSVGRLNNVGSEYVMFERDHQLWGSFAQGDSNFSDDPVSANAAKQYSRSQTIPSPIQHFHSTMEMSEITLSSLENDGYVVDGGVVKEEVGGQCVYSEESRSEMGGAQQMEQEQPPLLTNDNVTSQVIHPVQQQLDWLKGVAENSTDPVSSTNQNARNPRRPVRTCVMYKMGGPKSANLKSALLQGRTTNFGAELGQTLAWNVSLVLQVSHLYLCTFTIEI
ncbi:hypothetical protein GJAV_G00093720 [Gymnothorax javanicus]|nr:hypothetical protein GJAV_G00093720 [Gymnothorax javanicus]